MTALLELEGARIDRDGVPLCEGLSFSLSGARVCLVGELGGLFALLSGRAELVAGRVTLDGHDAAGALAAGLVGVAARDSLFPEAWELDRYLVEGARLGGLGKREARDAVRSVLGALELAHLTGRRISTLTEAEKRCAALALALLDAPPLLAVEDPVSDLDERSTELVCQALERAAAGRRLLLSTRVLPRFGPEHALFASADDVVVLEAGALVAQGPLAALTQPGARYLVSVTRHGAELSERLVAQGLAVTAATSETSAGARLVVSLPETGGTDPIVAAALEAEAPIVELFPLSTPRAG
ncbi:MAG: hypothetical protein HS104_01340 [Polyangiaceae bacterium]|nr:hypothetical protein [Polyangiaceae bacterium]MCE7891850.1 hypothetical protein [Sorangiineae bacterium PRO1]MCL4756551.1 hypothetical protein [Myxococcales bacterium]